METPADGEMAKKPSAEDQLAKPERLPKLRFPTLRKTKRVIVDGSQLDQKQTDEKRTEEVDPRAASDEDLTKLTVAERDADHFVGENLDEKMERDEIRDERRPKQGLWKWVFGSAFVASVVIYLWGDMTRIWNDGMPIKAPAHSEDWIVTPQPSLEADQLLDELSEQESIPNAVDPVIPNPMLGESADVNSPEEPTATLNQSPIALPQASQLSSEEVLKRFLEADSMEARLPLMMSQKGIQTMNQSLLAGFLTKHTEPLLEYREVDSATGRVAAYYVVDFTKADQSIFRQTLLVLTDEQGVSKVVVDPLLDLFGGRMLAFSQRPQQGFANFECIISVMGSCSDEKIPDRRQKLTVKLLSVGDGDEIARAYASRQSELAQMLEDGTFRLSYGIPTPCKIELRWNQEENPQVPYLEAVRIKAFGWESQ